MLFRSDAMGAGDAYLRETARRVLVTPATDVDVILHRQAVLADAREHPEVVRELYVIASEAVIGESRVWGAFLDQYAESVLARAGTVMELFGGLLRRVRDLADRNGAAFSSPGFRHLFLDIGAELDDAYLRGIDAHLERLRFRDGMLLSARLGAGNRG